LLSCARLKRAHPYCLVVYRVERAVKVQVQEATLEGRQQRQPVQYHQLPVPGRHHRGGRYAITAQDQGRSTTAVQRTVSTAPHVRQSDGFH